MSFLNQDLLSFNQTAENADEAIRLAGKLLQQKGYVSENYIEKMVESYHENGAYFVIAPYVAIPHARPTDGVEKSAVSLVTLSSGVAFGHKANDPVRLVFGLAASSSEEHLKVIQNIVALLSQNENIERLLEAKYFEEIQPILEGLK